MGARDDGRELRRRGWRAFALSCVLGLALVGCGAEPDAVAAQTERLGNPRLRDEAMLALGREYSRLLADAHGERSAPALRRFHDSFVPGAIAIHPELRQSAPAVADALVALLRRTQDPRALPVFLAELRAPDLPGPAALEAAGGVAEMELPTTRAIETLEALHGAFFALRLTRPADEELRRALVRALGRERWEAPATLVRRAELLGDIVRAQREEIAFAHRRSALAALARRPPRGALPLLVEALFLFDLLAPGHGLEDLALPGIVTLATEAPLADELTALLETSAIREASARQVAAWAQIDPLSDWTPALRRARVWTRTIELIGAPPRSATRRALEREIEREDVRRRVWAAAALALEPTLAAPAREGLGPVLAGAAREGGLPLGVRAQAAASLGDVASERAIGALLELARDHTLPRTLRVIAFRVHAELALGAERQRGGPRDALAEELGVDAELRGALARLDLRAEHCGRDLRCYLSGPSAPDVHAEESAELRVIRAQALRVARRRCLFWSGSLPRAEVRAVAEALLLDDAPPAQGRLAALAFQACAEGSGAEFPAAERAAVLERLTAAARDAERDAPPLRVPRVGPTEVLAARLRASTAGPPDTPASAAP